MTLDGAGARSGRLTVRGGATLERALANTVARVGEAVGATVAPSHLRALLLIGGYGRGEGGVERSGDAERPHNNLDFLLVLTPLGRLRAGAIRAAVDAALAPLARACGVGLDVGTVGELELSLAPKRVMWCDARAGHRLVLGGPEAVRRLFDRFDQPDLEDVGALLVNRATLLVLDRVLLSEAPPSPRRDRAIVRHAMKAVVGAGDAWLATRGRYHPSYLEKRRRLFASSEASPALVAAYARAIEFRLEPRYERFEGVDLREWTEEVVSAVEPIHLAVEASLLGRPGLSWSSFPHEAPRRAGVALLARPRGWPSALLEGLRGRRPLLDRAARLRLALPGVLYARRADVLEAFAREVLGLDGRASATATRRAYLAAWAGHADPNFASSMRALGVSAESLVGEAA